MSVTFRPTRFDPKVKCNMPLTNCDCTDRWVLDTEGKSVDDWPDPYQCDGCIRELNVSNDNCRDLLRWLGLEDSHDLVGDIKAPELAARCRRRLWDEDRNFDPVLTDEQRAEMNGIVITDRVIVTGRPAGYLRDRTKELLAIAEGAGEHFVSWD